MNNIDISTSNKGKIPTSTNGIKTYNKKTFGNKIYRFIQTNMQLTQNKQNSDITKAVIKTDKNRFISKKNTLVIKREELQREITTF